MEPDEKKDKKNLIDEFIKRASEIGIELTTEELQALKIPDSQQAMDCYGWMSWVFDLVGDKAPNKNEIQLDYVRVTDVYQEYLEDFNKSESPSDKPVTYQQFAKLWREIFWFVRVRLYKNVSGKCRNSVYELPIFSKGLIFRKM